MPPEAVTVNWTWHFLPYGGGDKWQFGDNPVFDWARVACVLFAMLLLMSCLRVIAESRRRDEHLPRTQVARFLSLALFTVSVALTEVAVVGSVATPRLPLNLVATALGFYGVNGMRRKQKRLPPK
jgi:hypothetical protein